MTTTTNTPEPRPAIISKAIEHEGGQMDWYFSNADGTLFLSGFRKYEKDHEGKWFIAARWYPDSHALPRMIPLTDVPVPDDVIKELIHKAYIEHPFSPEPQEVFVRRGTSLITVETR